MSRAFFVLAVVVAAAAPAAAAAATDYCNCPYGPYSRAYQNCAADCAAHADEAGPDRVAKLFAQEKAMIKDSVEFRATLPNNGTQVVHAPHMLGGAASDCSSLSSDGAQFLCGLAVRVFEAYFGKDTLLNCLADAAVSVDDFWHAASQIKSAYSDWNNDHDVTAGHELEHGLSSAKSGLSKGLQVFRECPGLDSLASKVAGIVGDLESGFGDIIEALKALFSGRDIALKAEDIISHWGDYIEVGEDAADIVCDLSDFLGSGCGGRRLRR